MARSRAFNQVIGVSMKVKGMQVFTIIAMSAAWLDDSKCVFIPSLFLKQIKFIEICDNTLQKVLG